MYEKILGNFMTIIIAMCLYSLSMSITPGPVNLITLSTGINYGFKSALPFVSGATIGFTLLLYSIGLGISQVANEHSVIMDFSGFLGSFFIGYIGYKVATSLPEIKIEKTKAPTFFYGFLLQWLNPKAWIASMAGVSAFSLAEENSALIIFVCIYFVICYFSIAAWAYTGERISYLFQQPKHLRRINILMGLSLIVISIYLIISIFIF